MEEAFKAVNRHIRYIDFDSHGYGVFEVSRAAAQMDWFYLSDPTDPRAAATHGASFRVAVRRAADATGGAPLDPAAYRP